MAGRSAGSFLSIPKCVFRSLKEILLTYLAPYSLITILKKFDLWGEIGFFREKIKFRQKMKIL